MADRLGVSILHGPSTEHRVGDSDPELCVAAAAGVCTHPPPDCSHAHSGRRHSEESAGEGGRRAGCARVPRLATGRRQNHRLSTYQVSDNQENLFGAMLIILFDRCHNLSEYMKIAEKVKEFFHNEGIHSTTIQPEFTEVCL